MEVVAGFEAYWALELCKFFGRCRHVTEYAHIVVIVNESFTTLTDRSFFKLVQELAEFFEIVFAPLALVKFKAVNQELAIPWRLEPNGIDIILEALCHGIVVLIDHDQGLERHEVAHTAIRIVPDHNFEIAIFVLESNPRVCIVQPCESSIQSIG
jgi:hypothetical protein